MSSRTQRFGLDVEIRGPGGGFFVRADSRACVVSPSASYTRGSPSSETGEFKRVARRWT